MFTVPRSLKMEKTGYAKHYKEGKAEIELLGKLHTNGLVWSYPKFKGHPEVVEFLKKTVGEELKPRRTFQSFHQAVKYAEKRGFTFKYRAK